MHICLVVVSRGLARSKDPTSYGDGDFVGAGNQAAQVVNLFSLYKEIIIRDVDPMMFKQKRRWQDAEH